MKGYLRVAATLSRQETGHEEHGEDRRIQIVRQAAAEGVQLLVLPKDNTPSTPDGREKAWHTLLADTAAYDTAVCTWTDLQLQGRTVEAAVFFCRGRLLWMMPSAWDARILPPVTALTYAGQHVPFGRDGRIEADSCGLSACRVEELGDLSSPVACAALQGAHVFCCYDPAGKWSPVLLSACAASLRAAFVYVSDRQVAVIESGDILTSGDVRCVADVDTDRLRAGRTGDSIFADVLTALRLDGRTDGRGQPDEPEDAMSARMHRRDRIIKLQLAEPQDERLLRDISPWPFVPAEDVREARCAEIFSMQVSALARRLAQVRPDTVLIGVSGGLDSTLALLVIAGAMDYLGWERSRITGVTMPGFGTTSRTYQNAVGLIKSLGATFREISIREACLQHFSDIGHDPAQHDVTYENAQARERTQILMDLGNRENGLVVGTGDLSELALGWATYNGDHMSMYGVNGDLPKTLIRHIVRWAAGKDADEAVRRCLLDVLDTPVSPELLPADAEGHIAQKTESLVGPYDLHDFFLYYTLRYGYSPEKICFMACHAFSGTFDRPEIVHWMKTFYRRFFTQQFKRSCMPDGPKILSVGLSPRGDWSMPSDAVWSVWREAVERL
ncbi:MAG: NAD(+) synthase [Bacteroidales bacterium]|nr:NAD(+) synthase [Bacteroidales bacterium]